MSYKDDLKRGILYLPLNGETMYEFTKKVWKAQDEKAAEQDKTHKETFTKLLNKSIVYHNIDMVVVLKDILSHLGGTYDRTSSTKDSRRYIRFVIGKAGKDGGRTGDEPEVVTNAKQEDAGIKPRKDVHYRWKNKSG